MTMKNNTERDTKLQAKICADFGADLDSPLCEEVGKLMDDYPEIRTYYETLKRSVKLYQSCECEQTVPAEVSERLLNILKLGKSKS